MKALGILSALFAGLNGVDTFQDAPQAKKSKVRIPPQKKRRKKEPLPPSAIELLLGIKELAQKGLEATAMTTKDTRLRTIIKRVGKP